MSSMLRAGPLYPVQPATARASRVLSGAAAVKSGPSGVLRTEGRVPGGWGGKR